MAMIKRHYHNIYNHHHVARLSSGFILLLFILIILPNLQVNAGEDYYELLGISKSADNREIRKAFKKLALTHHPDKNKDDPKANEIFIKINRAYEVLKDDELRKKYDLHGEEGLSEDFGNNRGHSWHSWSYYEESFGIYDDDPQIITLSRSEFEASVTNSPFIWFINFYSPQCSHCHHIAPEWRSLARDLENVIRIGAINCEEDWSLCREQKIPGFPTLLLYPERERYDGKRTAEAMTEYILSKLPNKVIKFHEDLVKTKDEQNFEYWLISFCYEKTDCQFEDSLKKIAIALDGLAKVTEINCQTNPELCKKFGVDDKAIRLYSNIVDEKDYFEIPYSQDTKDVITSVLEELPGLKKLNGNELKSVITETSKSSANKSSQWVILFSKDSKEDELTSKELKRLPPLLKGVNTGRINCETESETCSQFPVNVFPKFLVFKSLDSYEVYHGRISAHDVATFALESLISNLNTLSPVEFEQSVIKRENVEYKPWIVDFYAPWCPPCMSLMPEVRKASRNINHLVNFGTVDCTIHSALCRKYNIRSYPTLLLYNQSTPHQFFGSHKAADLIEFVQDTLNPPVETLTLQSFQDQVINRDADTVYLVDFYAPWCRPCQEFAPHWRKVAKAMKVEKSVKIAQVNCQDQENLCSSQGIKTYPTIRLYPAKKDSRFKEPFLVYNGYNRDATSVRVWIYYYLPSVVRTIDSPIHYEKLLRSNKGWLVDYYAPWCGHCQTFVPDFEVVAKRLKEELGVRAAKIDCQENFELCSRAGVRAYPTLRFYSGSPDGDMQDAFGHEINSYQPDTIISLIKQFNQHLKHKNTKDEL